MQKERSTVEQDKIIILQPVKSRTFIPPQVNAKLLQSCLTLCNFMDCSPPGSSVHGILQEGYWSGWTCLPGDLPNPGIEPCLRHLLHC